jgi:hypothetical protein
MKFPNDPLPFDSRIVKIDEQAKSQVRGPKIVEALRRVFTSQTIHTLQLDHQLILNDNVGNILSDHVTLIRNSQRSLGASPDAAKPESPLQSPLVNLLKKPGPQSMGNLKHSTDHPLRQRS